MKYIILPIFLLLMSCSSKTEQVAVVQKEIIRKTPDIAMTNCEDLEEIKSGDLNTLAESLAKNASLYYQCEEKRKALQKFIENK